MSALIAKLNHKGQTPVYVLAAPESLADELAGLGSAVKTALGSTRTAAFVLVFATKKAEVDLLAERIAKAAPGDAIIWVAYPKASSKRYKCDFNRDNGWDRMGANGFEPVRQVAIDEDWSALRFRRVEFIAKMTRSFAMTEAGKEKAAKR